MPHQQLVALVVVEQIHWPVVEAEVLFLCVRIDGPWSVLFQQWELVDEGSPDPDWCFFVLQLEKWQEGIDSHVILTTKVHQRLQT